MKLIKCSKCKSENISFTAMAYYKMFFYQNENGLNSDGCDYDSDTNQRVCCYCQDCGHEFRISKKRFDEIDEL